MSVEVNPGKCNIYILTITNNILGNVYVLNTTSIMEGNRMIKCVKCGTEFDETAKVCPNCNCPVQESTTEEKTGDTPSNVPEENKKPASKGAKINILAVITLVVGIAILIMGVQVKNKQFNIETYKASSYEVDSYSFGGDFFTEIYKGVETVVDVINDINGGIASLSESVVEFSEMVTYSAGMIIIAIGLGVIVISVLHIKKD